jgi:hypothetical protein
MTKKIYLSLALTVLSMTSSENTIDTATSIKNQLTFIADQKEAIKQEEPRLISNYQHAKDSLRRSIDGNADEIINNIKTVVSLILESQEFTNYNEYMTDFQYSLIATGGFKAEEIPSTNPDKTLFIKINKIITEKLPSGLLETPEIHTFFGTLLTLEANKIGTKLLLEKLSLKERQLATELNTLQ